MISQHHALYGASSCYGAGKSAAGVTFRRWSEKRDVESVDDAREGGEGPFGVLWLWIDRMGWWLGRVTSDKKGSSVCVFLADLGQETWSRLAMIVKGECECAGEDEDEGHDGQEEEDAGADADADAGDAGEYEEGKYSY